MIGSFGHASARARHPAAESGGSRLTPLTGVLFPVFFVAGVVVSSPPADNATDRAWVASYASHGKQLEHLATGFLLVFAGLCLLAFLTQLWMTVAAARAPRPLSPLPLLAGGVSAACIAAGGVSMAVIAGAALIGPAPVPGADLLRLGNDLGFALVAVGGMLSAALAVACLSIQARTAGVFGRKLTIFGLAAAALQLGALAFVPIVALLAWTVVVAIALRRPQAGLAIEAG